MAHSQRVEDGNYQSQAKFTLTVSSMKVERHSKNQQPGSCITANFHLCRTVGLKLQKCCAVSPEAATIHYDMYKIKFSNQRSTIPSLSGGIR
jgi:hypothetical protein